MGVVLPVPVAGQEVPMIARAWDQEVVFPILIHLAVVAMVVLEVIQLSVVDCLMATVR